MASGLRYGDIGQNCVHLCVDMQRLFSSGSPWEMPWMEKVLPRVHAIALRHAEDTVFTRFIPPRHPEEMRGVWRRYYERWPSVTLAELEPGRLDLATELAVLTPPALVIDKSVYSPWTGGQLEPLLQERGTDTLIITGGETDVCVLATVMGAVDRGYRVILATDALCSSSDATHDALLELYRSRFSAQIETATTETVLSAW